MAAFTADQMAGQRLIVGFEGLALNQALKRLIDTYHVGGLILFANNIAGPGQLRALCISVQAYARQCNQPPLFIAVDQEGGPVARLKRPFSEFAGNAAMQETGEAVLFAQTTADELKSVGINMNLAPVLDVALDPQHSVMNQRAFGKDPQHVATMGLAVIRTLQQRGVMSVAKHYPGIGRTTLDSHLDQPRLAVSLSDLTACDLVPFRTAIRNQVSGIMLSHARYTRIDDTWPASLSKTIAADLLRKQMGYAGLVMTDDLDMGAVQKHYDIETMVGRICRAQIDIALICHAGPAIRRAFAALRRIVKQAPDQADRCKTALDRIMALKEAYLASSPQP